MRSAWILVATLLGGILPTAQAPAPSSGLALAHFDTSVRPQDDLHRYANGGWAARASMPPERVAHGPFTELADKAMLDMHALVLELSKAPDIAPGSSAQKIGDLYASLMDVERLDALGSTPIEPELARIDAMATVADVSFRSGHLAAIASGGPFGASAAPDSTNPRGVIVTIPQGGTLLPDREYYRSAETKFAAARQKYQGYLQLLFELTKRAEPRKDAAAVLAFETALAEAQSPQAQAGAQARGGTRYALAALMREMPGFHWVEWARAQGIDARSDVILAQPAFFRRFASLVAETPLPTLRAWLAARHITAAAPFLSAPFDNARFEFFGRVLSGQETPIVRWKRGVSMVNGHLGDAAGRLYVERHFPPDARRRVEAMVANLIEASRQAISEAAWMTPPMREVAMERARGIAARIGYPDKWRDYTDLVIRRDDLYGNVERAQRFENAYRLSLLRRAPGRNEWLTPPQTINAFYRPGLNEIIVPAGLLQPPMFQMDADDAVNYGGIGAVIGHELGHAFDQSFQPHAAALVEQFNALRSVDGMPVNGQLTLGENIGDLSGLALAHRAYRISLKGRTAPVLDGFTGGQRFFLGWAQVWRSIMRDEYLRQWLLWMPYAPPEFRANAPVRHIDAFHEAFNVQPGDKLYLEPAKRVRIW